VSQLKTRLYSNYDKDFRTALAGITSDEWKQYFANKKKYKI
jgi:hypothetical protein